MRFNFFGTQVHISFMFSAVIVLLLIFDKSYTAVFAVLAATIHELAHLCCFIYFGQVPKKVEVNALGMRIARGESTKLSLQQEALSALAGPAINIVLALTTVAMTKIEWASRATAINLSLAVFNLLPIFELDGGRAIYYLLCTKFEDKTARSILVVLSTITLFLLYLLGFTALLISGYNFTLLATTIYLTALTVAKKPM